MEKKLKIALLVLIMVLIILVGFGGIYVKKLVSYSNILPEYKLGDKLTGSRITTLKVDDSNKSEIYDSDGKKVDEIPGDADKSNYTTVEVPVNKVEDIKSENYTNTFNIIKKRLDYLKASNYDVRLNSNNGEMYIELPDNENTDKVLSYLVDEGKFEIVDTNSQEVLLSNNDLEKVSVMYYPAEKGTSIYLNFAFTAEGKNKMKQVSRDYAKIETETEEDKDNQKTITLNVNDSKLLSTSFEDEIDSLQISIGAATSDADTLSQYVDEANYYATVLRNGKLPLKYIINSSDYMHSIYGTESFKNVLLVVFGCLTVLSLVYFVIRYKGLGCIGAIAYISGLALLLILTRFVGIKIELESLVAALVLIVTNVYIIGLMLKNLNSEESFEERKKNVTKACLKSLDVLTIVLITAVVFTFNTFAGIATIGTILFWEVISILLINFMFLRSIFITLKK